MKNFYINTATFKNAVTSVQVFKSDKFSKHISPSMIRNIVLQDDQKKDVFELPMEMIKFVKTDDAKVGDKKIEIAKDADEQGVGFVIGHNPKARVQFTQLMKAKGINLDYIKRIKVVYNEAQLETASLNTSMVSNQSNLSDVSLMENLANLDINAEEIAKLNAEIEAVRKQEAETQSQLQQTTERYADLQVQYQLTQQDRDQIRDQLNQRASEIATMTASLTTANQSLADRQAEYDRVRGEFQNAQERFAKAEADRDSYKQQYTDAGAERDRLRSRLNELEAEIVGLRNQIVTLNNDVATKAQEIVRLNGVIAQKDTAIQQKQTELTALAQQLQNMTNEKNHQQQTAAQYANQLQALTQQNSVKDQQIAKLSAEVADLQKKYLAKYINIVKELYACGENVIEQSRWESGKRKSFNLFHPPCKHNVSAQIENKVDEYYKLKSSINVNNLNINQLINHIKKTGKYIFHFTNHIYADYPGNETRRQNCFNQLKAILAKVGLKCTATQLCKSILIGYGNDTTEIV